METETPSTEIERGNLGEQGIAELSSSSLGEKIAEESSKEIEKVLKHLREISVC